MVNSSSYVLASTDTISRMLRRIFKEDRNYYNYEDGYKAGKLRNNEIFAKEDLK